MTGEWFESLIKSLRESGQTDEQRRSIRVGLRFTAKMAIIQPGQTPQSITIWVKDVSDQGIGFTADRRLLTGQKIAIWVPQARSDPLRILAEVRNCRELENNLFSIGALFIHMSPVPKAPEGPAARAPEPVAAVSSPAAKPAAAPASGAPHPAPAVATQDQVAAIRRAIFG